MCTLRIGGPVFDVDEFLDRFSFVPSGVFRKGTPRRPHADPSGPTIEDSGVSIAASDAEWSDLPTQVRDVEAFLAANNEELREVAKLPKLEQFVLDFPIDLRAGLGEIVAQSDYFPTSLVAAAASIGLALELTIYS